MHEQSPRVISIEEDLMKPHSRKLNVNRICSNLCNAGSSSIIKRREASIVNLATRHLIYDDTTSDILCWLIPVKILSLLNLQLILINILYDNTRSYSCKFYLESVVLNKFSTDIYVCLWVLLKIDYFRSKLWLIIVEYHATFQVYM